MGEPLNTISALGEVRVRFPISESDYLRFAKRAKEKSDASNATREFPVELVLSDNSIFNEIGKMDLANRQIDPQTGSLTLQAVFQNKERLLRPGQYVKVRLKTDEYKDAVMVPQSAINQLQGIYQVFILGDSSKLKPRIIVPGDRVGSNWIVKEGIQEGEKVAIIGNAGINPKNAVKPVMINWNYDSTSRK
jgi:membrane fusion protein (multidrug efflux system)